MVADNQITKFHETLVTNAQSFGLSLSAESIERLTRYFALLNKWNPRLHLVAPCSPEEFAVRHILESLMVPHELPEGATVADIGSGAGLPLMPCLITRPDIRGILIESSPKKAVFLREALKETAVSSQAEVIAKRFADLQTPDVTFVTCRALDRFQELLPEIVRWSPASSTLLLFGGDVLQNKLSELKLTYSRTLIPQSENRYLFTVKR